MVGAEHLAMPSNPQNSQTFDRFVSPRLHSLSLARVVIVIVAECVECREFLTVLAVTVLVDCFLGRFLQTHVPSFRANSASVVGLTRYQVFSFWTCVFMYLYV